METIHDLRFESKFLTNPADINLSDIFQDKVFIKNRQEIILIESFIRKEASGHLLITPLFSKSKPRTRQTVLFSNLVYNSFNEAVMLIKQGLMCSWEMDYQVAFSLNKGQFYHEAGFEKVPDNFYNESNRKFELFYSELTWNGFNNISKDLILPEINMN